VQSHPTKADAQTPDKKQTSTRIDSQNAKNVVRTNAVKGVPVKKNSTKTLDKAPVKVEK